jgi:putative ABC transport system permease protein
VVFRERRYQWLLRLLPGSFREEHERELLRVWKEEAGDANPERHTRVWAGALKDTMRIAPREFAEAGLRNLSTAMRAFRRAPAFALAAVLTLAIGTGATAAVFTLVNAVVLRPLPFAAPDRVGIVWALQPSGDRTWLSFPELEELQREVPALGAAAGLTDLRPTLIQDGVAHELQALAVSHDFFAVLGVTPTRGRGFSVDDERDGAAPVVILSDGVWRTRFGAQPSVIGRRMRLNDRDYEVIGVLPPTFSLLPASTVMPEHVDLWLPLEPHLPARDRSIRFLHAVARLGPDVTFAQADQQLRAYGMRVTGSLGAVYRGGTWQFTVVPFADDVLKSARTSLSLVFGLVLLVLVMACANVANLLLARGEARRADLSVRAALGAGPARLAGELLSEALVLAVAGSVLGFALAAIVPSLLRAWDPTALPRLEDAEVDFRVAAFTAFVSLGCAAVVAVAPLVERARLRGVNTALVGRSGGRTRRSARAGGALVVIQTALATTVLITTFFLTATLVQLHRTNLGFATERLLTARIGLGPQSAVSADPSRFFDAAVAAVERIPGVVNAAAITQLPLSGAMLGSTFLVEPGPEARRIDADLRGITPDYLDVAGIATMRGRAFNTHDAATAAPVAIVDAAFAERLRPDGDVVGRRIRWVRAPEVEIEIIGVVRSVHHRGPAAPVRETVYRPHRQYARASMFLVTRTTTDPSTIAPDIRAAVSGVDPTQPVADVLTMAQRRDASVQRTRTVLLLAGVLSGLALALTIVGLYGVLSFGVAQRLREFGVRLSLGASPASVRSLVLKEGLTLTSIGLAAGVAGAVGVAMTIRSALFGTNVADPRQYAYGVAAVTVVSVIAFWAPARRASAVDPAITLRAE